MNDFFSDPAPGFDAPIEMLIACHDRVKHFSGLAVTLAEHVRVHGADAPAKQAATSILRYFDTAAPRHHADEEENLFPLLKPSLSAPNLAILNALEAEHVVLGTLWSRLRRELLCLVNEGVASLNPLLCAEFAQRYQLHAEQEERYLYTDAVHLLSAAQLAEIGNAMLARRRDE